MTDHSLPGTVQGGSIRTGLARMLSGLRAVRAALRPRRYDLSALSERDLRDIGLARGDVAREGTRPYWDLPPDALLPPR